MIQSAKRILVASCFTNASTDDITKQRIERSAALHGLEGPSVRWTHVSITH